MKTIAVAPKNEKDFSFISELLKKLGYNPMILSEDEIEDRNLLKMMVKEKKEDYVSRDEVMKALGENES
jgi:hypothetical protein